MVACGTVPAGQGSEIPALVMQTGQQCRPAPDGWRATWIATSEALGAMRARCRSNFIPVEPADDSKLDFDRFAVLAVEMGQQTTAGYGFDSDGVTARLQDRVLTICLAYHRPDPGAVTAQVLTSPWIWVRLPVGNYEGIRVVDPDGRFLVQIDDIPPMPDESS
jgi:hypothetical protein